MVSPPSIDDTPPEDESATPTENAMNDTPRKVCVVADGFMIQNVEYIESLYKELHKRIWEYMKSPTGPIPLFESCSKLDPFGIQFVCNDDAVSWLVATVATTPFLNRRIVVRPLENLPKRVRMYVSSLSIPSAKAKRTCFNVLVNTNRSLYATGLWGFEEAESAGGEGVVFTVPLAGVPELRSRAFVLYFVFGKLTAMFYRPELPNQTQSI